MEIERYKNRRMNRYVKYQIERLNKSRYNPIKFWRLAEGLMRSTSYITICYNAVHPKWYKTKSYGTVWKEVERLVKLDVRKYLYKVVLIPKLPGSKELRPIGVPSSAWRVYLHAVNNLLMIWLSLYIPASQHGFYPSLTASRPAGVLAYKAGRPAGGGGVYITLYFIF